MRFEPVNPSQRLAYALGLAAAAHAAVILGIRFGAPIPPSSPAMPALEIVLSTAGLETEPDDEAEYFGTEDRAGGGNTAEQVKARLPEPDINPSEGRDVAGASLQQPSPMSGSDNRDLIATRQNDDQQVVQDLLPEQPSTVAAARRTITLAPVATSRNPKERFLSVNTRQTLFAGYLADWKSKVERVGTLNFPDEAQRLRREGGPVLEVAINSDGSVAEILVRQSSGDKGLDQAAVRILKLASPFDPFPRELRDRFEILRFAYEWRFMEGPTAKGRQPR
jgi:protein TonB